jgi:hypothetical protein
MDACIPDVRGYLEREAVQRRRGSDGVGHNGRQPQENLTTAQDLTGTQPNTTVLTPGNSGAGPRKRFRGQTVLLSIVLG